MIATEADKKLILYTIDKAIKNGSFFEKEVILFGCTLYAKDIRDILKDNGIQISAFIDNNTQKVGKSCLGIPVYMPKDFLLPYKENIIVIICSKYSHEMTEQLKEMEYSSKSILKIPIAESQNVKGDSLEELEREFAEVCKGYTLYREICERYPKKMFLFICPYPGTGDIYMACSYLREYLFEKRIQDFIFLVIGDNCKRTAELFSIKNIVSISKHSMQKILKAWEFLGCKKMNLKPLLYWGWRTKRYLYADRHSQITFTEMFLYDVYEFENAVQGQIPDRKENSVFAQQLFEKMVLPKGKTIIIAPYAGSFESSITMEQWIEVVEILKSKKYEVCTNCYGEKEVPIPGTLPIMFPYKEAINVLEYAGGFIAVRSGLCDIVSSADCRIVVIYENGFNASRYEYFSLKKMGLSNKVKEIFVDENIVNSIIEKF